MLDIGTEKAREIEVPSSIAVLDAGAHLVAFVRIRRSN
jgi:uncharacterized protein GlcG (DUF336 family)